MERYLPMIDDEVWRFLDEQKILCLATINADNTPHNTPVWYAVYNKKIYFRADDNKVKVRNISRNPRVSCVVEAGVKYTELRGVTIFGRARTITDKKFRKIVNNLLLDRYAYERNYEDMPEAWRKKYEQADRAIIEISPEKITSWDNRKWLSRNNSR